MLYINKLYLLVRDAKLLLRDSIYKLYINTVYLFLRDAKLRESIHLQIYVNTSVPPSEGYQTPSEGFHFQVKNTHLLLRNANLLLRDSMLAILRCLLPYAPIIQRFLIFKEQRSFK